MTKGFWSQDQNFSVLDVNMRIDMLLRCGIVACAGIALFFATEQVFYPLWAAAFLLSHAAYAVAIRKIARPLGPRGHVALLAMYYLSSSLYAVVPVYLWLAYDDVALQTIALCGILGHAIFSLSRHARLTATATWDLLLTGLSLLIVGANLVFAVDGAASKSLVLFGTMAVLLYFVMAQITSLRDREALAASRDELIEAHKQRTMGQITAGVAHDFNNKLTVIRGNIELALIAHDPQERAALLEEARQASSRAADVVAHMQAFVRKSPLHITTFELSEFARSLNLRVGPHIPENITFQLQLDATRDAFACDRDLLGTALMNLVLNAREAMEGRGGHILLRIAPGDLTNWSGKPPKAQGPFLRFDVVDEGPGLPVDIFEQVQEPFFTSKPKGRSTGLGLSMVKGFTEQIGGALKLRNRQGGGLTVSIILPVQPIA